MVINNLDFLKNTWSIQANAIWSFDFSFGKMRVLRVSISLQHLSLFQKWIIYILWLPNQFSFQRRSVGFVSLISSRGELKLSWLDARLEKLENHDKNNPCLVKILEVIAAIFKVRVARKQKHVCCMTSLFEITFTHKAQNSKKACLKSSVNESNTIAF